MAIWQSKWERETKDSLYNRGDTNSVMKSQKAEAISQLNGLKTVISTNYMHLVYL